jgi:hypothetical protein
MTPHSKAQFTARSGWAYVVVPFDVLLLLFASSAGWLAFVLAWSLVAMHAIRLFSLRTFRLTISEAGITICRRRRQWVIPWRDVITVESAVSWNSPIIAVRTSNVAGFPRAKGLPTIPPVYDAKTGAVVICRLPEIRQRWREVDQALTIYAGSSWIGGPLPSRTAAFAAGVGTTFIRMLRWSWSDPGPGLGKVWKWLKSLDRE